MNPVATMLIAALTAATAEAAAPKAGRTAADTWRDSRNGKELLAMAQAAGVDRKLLVRAACGCARKSIVLAGEGEEPARKALDAAEKWTREEEGVTPDEVRKWANETGNFAVKAAGESATNARMAVVFAVQPVYNPFTIFTIPHAAVLAGRAVSSTVSQSLGSAELEARAAEAKARADSLAADAAAARARANDSALARLLAAYAAQARDVRASNGADDPESRRAFLERARVHAAEFREALEETVNDAEAAPLREANAESLAAEARDAGKHAHEADDYARSTHVRAVQSEAKTLADCADIVRRTIGYSVVRAAGKRLKKAGDTAEGGQVLR